MKKILLMLAMLAGMMVAVVAPAQQANASVPGCDGSITKKVSVWYESDTWTDPIVPMNRLKVNMSAAVFYYYCPQGDLPNKVKPKGVEFCIQPDGSDRGLQRVEFDGKIFENDGNNGILLPDVDVPADGDNKKVCRRYDIPPEQEAWMRMADRPSYEVDSKIATGPMTPDESVMYWYASGEPLGRRLISPSADRTYDFSGFRVTSKGFRSMPAWPSGI